jgi:DNA-binding NarL/FixJ family response regulator
VLVVDADSRTRDSLAGLLEVRGRFQVVGRAGDGTEAEAMVRDRNPDIVVMDPRLPEVDGGLTLIRTLRSRHPEVVILAVGWGPDLEHDLLAAGASSFVRKTFRPAELAEAIGRCFGPDADPAPSPAAPPEV